MKSCKFETPYPSVDACKCNNPEMRRIGLKSNCNTWMKDICRYFEEA